jgi:hypothetical protein
MVLASLQSKGFPSPSTNKLFIWGPADPCGIKFSIFSIEPAWARISYFSPNPNSTTNDIPGAQTVRTLAFEQAFRLGLDSSNLMPSEVYAITETRAADRLLTNGVYGRGIVLARKLDGAYCFSYGKGGIDVDGLILEFGAHGKIRSFTFLRPDLEPVRRIPTPNPEKIIRLVREHRAMLLPEEGGTNYFARLKSLAKASTLTITKITSYYDEGLLV